MRKFALYTFLLFAFILSTHSQTIIKKNNWEWHISEKGYAESLVFKGKKGNDTIPFFSGKAYDGPAFYIKNDDKVKIGEWHPNGWNNFRTSIDGIVCELSFFEHNTLPSFKVKLINESRTVFQPTKAGIKLGLDIYMDKYPEWYSKLFPTLMRCEKTHFYGYLQTPNEYTLGIISEEPVASWSIDYNVEYGTPPYMFMGHRLESVNLDLLNALPLPAHHPHDLYELKKGEEKTWVISFVNVGELNNLETALSQSAHFPVIKLAQTSYKPGDKARFEVHGNLSNVTMLDEKGLSVPVEMKKISSTKHEISATLPHIGLYTIKAHHQGKESEAILSARNTWQWAMEKAREGVIKYKQRATSHAESWYGYYSAFIAAKYFPDKKIDELNSERFDFLFDLLHEPLTFEPKVAPTRIQNTSTTIGMLVDKFEAEGNIEDLKKATALGDWLIATSQKENGAYYNRQTIYTSVIYIAKSVLELALAEKELADTDIYWANAYKRHYDSAKRAIDQLVDSNGEYDTEGQVTFDESTIACSALQMGMLALLQENKDEREHYKKAMLEILNSHSCVTQLRVPDARQRQGTLRFWESQYDVQMLPNMFNSPHGWSGWRAYATYYAYLLTGQEQWLLETFNAMGAFSHLIDYQTGNLRWAFVPDPYVEALQACSPDTYYTADSVSYGNPHPLLYDTRTFIVGEQYVDMISDWQTINTQDNDVHEVFKCIGETVLTNAFIVERENGEIVGYNCKLRKNGNTLEVDPDEKQIVNLHCNLKNKYTVKFKSGKSKTKTLTPDYCDWL